MYVISKSVVSMGLVVALAGLAAGAELPAKFKVGEFTFQRPAGWESVQPSSSMRAAQMKITAPKADGAAEVVFFHFGPGDGGGTQANIDRWLGQFQEPKDKINSKVEEAKVGKRKVIYVQAQGTYSGSMAGHPAPVQPNTMLLGAILESTQGNVFIKLTGPAALVNSSKEAFKKMTEAALKAK